jgi:copper chaperone CopZ
MDRRKFLYHVMAGMAGTTTTIALTETSCNTDARAARENRSIACQVKGFTCETCAVGLETMLLQQKGVTRASASYSDASVVIAFDGNLTSGKELREFIASCGFSVT